MTSPTVRRPKAATLERYGLTAEEWLRLLGAQGGVCAICRRFPPSGRLVTDHEHVRGWAKMPPPLRKRYVRGITCWTCNRYYLARGITVERAENVSQYLRDYYARRGASAFLAAA